LRVTIRKTGVLNTKAVETSNFTIHWPHYNSIINEIPTDIRIKALIYKLWLWCSVMWHHTVLQIGTNILNKPATYNIKSQSQYSRLQECKFHIELLYSNWWYTGDMYTACNQHKHFCIPSNFNITISQSVWPAYNWQLLNNTIKIRMLSPNYCHKEMKKLLNENQTWWYIYISLQQSS
jgi:hypothetical protein